MLAESPGCARNAWQHDTDAAPANLAAREVIGRGEGYPSPRCLTAITALLPAGMRCGRC